MKKTFLLLFALLPMLLSAQNLAPKKHHKKVLYGYWGEMKNGKEGFVIKPKFEKAHPFVGEYAFVCHKGLWGIIGKDGKFVVKPKYDYASIPYGNITIVKLGERLGFVENGRKEVVFAGKYKEIVPLQNGIFAICTDKWEFMDADEKSVQHPGNVLLYTSTYGNTIDRSRSRRDYYFWQVNVVSNTCHNGQGIMVFDKPITSIGTQAFYRCSGLTSITIPNSVTSIGDYAFYGCTDLTSITIPDSVTSIGYRAFEDCEGLTSITIPNSVTWIGERAFYNCKSLTSITIPDSVTKIGSEAFYGCSSLPVIDGIRYADTYLVEVADKTKTSYSIKPGVLYIPSITFENCQSLTNITIPDSVTEIRDKAFYGCIGLTSITLPESVTTLGRETFAYCINLKNVTTGNRLAYVAGDCFVGCTSLPVIDGIMYADHIMVEVVDKNRTSYSIKQGPLYIPAGAFRGCSSLTSITIPNSVTSIGDYAFYGCTDLTSITIPDSVTSIGYRAFEDCEGLTSITIPNSVTRIGGWAFEHCDGLKTVYCNAAVPPTLDVHSYFLACFPNGCTFYVPAASLTKYINAEVWKYYKERIRAR